MTLYDTNDPLAAPHVEPLTVDNALWTNTVVASGTAVGLVVYTGSETRRYETMNNEEGGLRYRQQLPFCSGLGECTFRKRLCPLT
jgi:hypothetical protein